MSVHHCILHFLDKQPDERPAQMQLSSNEITDTGLLDALLSDFNQHYNSKSGKVWACFNPDADSSLAPLLEQYLQKQLDFVSLSTTVAKRWQQTLDEQQIFMRAHLCLLHYQHGMSNYLALAFIPQTRTLQATEGQGLSFVEHLDAAQMQLAARINLHEWQNNPESGHYISLLKAKGGKKVVEAFNLLLGCQEGADAPQETRNLLQAFSDYVEDSGLNEETAKEKTTTLVRYANKQSRQGAPVALDDLSEVLDEENPQAFYNHIRNKDYGLSAHVPTDRRTLSQFQRFSGRAEGMSISFEAHLLGSRIEYDPQHDHLIIRNPPTQLKDQLKRNN